MKIEINIFNLDALFVGPMHAGALFLSLEP